MPQACRTRDDIAPADTLPRSGPVPPLGHHFSEEAAAHRQGLRGTPRSRRTSKKHHQQRRRGRVGPAKSHFFSAQMRGGERGTHAASSAAAMPVRATASPSHPSPRCPAATPRCSATAWYSSMRDATEPGHRPRPWAATPPQRALSAPECSRKIPTTAMPGVVRIHHWPPACWAALCRPSAAARCTARAAFLARQRWARWSWRQTHRHPGRPFHPARQGQLAVRRRRRARGAGARCCQRRASVRGLLPVQLLGPQTGHEAPRAMRAARTTW